MWWRRPPSAHRSDHFHQKQRTTKIIIKLLGYFALSDRPTAIYWIRINCCTIGSGCQTTQRRRKFLNRLSRTVFLSSSIVKCQNASSMSSRKNAIYYNSCNTLPYGAAYWGRPVNMSYSCSDIRHLWTYMDPVRACVYICVCVCAGSLLFVCDVSG